MATPWLHTLGEENTAAETQEASSPAFLDVFAGDADETPVEMRQRVLAEAGREAELLKEQAHQQGLVEGRAEAAREAAEQMQLLASMLAATEAELIEREKRYTALAADFAVETAKRLVTEAVAVDDQLVREVVGELLGRAHNGGRMVLTVAADDEQTVKQLLEGDGLATQEIRVVVDPGLGRGSCQLETEEGELQASTALALDRLQQAVSRAKG